MIANTLYKLIGNRLSPAGPSARLSILIYHRVLAQRDPLFPHEPTVETFDAQLGCLKRAFNVLPLHDAVKRLKTGTLPARAACITFDDGYADNLTLATPILKKHRLHATVFIATAYLHGGRMFNDTVIEAIRRSALNVLNLDELGLGQFDIADDGAKARAIGQILPQVKYLPVAERETKVAQIAALTACGALPTDLMLSTEQLRQLHAAGMEIGGHTAQHPILAKLNAEAAHKEIAAGKEYLENVLSERVRLFAYPNGKPGVDYLPQQAEIVRALGFDAAVSTQGGTSTQTSDVFQLPRFTPWSPARARFVPALLDNLRR